MQVSVYRKVDNSLARWDTTVSEEFGIEEIRQEVMGQFSVGELKRSPTLVLVNCEQFNEKVSNG